MCRGSGGWGAKLSGAIMSFVLDTSPTSSSTMIPSDLCARPASASAVLNGASANVDKREAADGETARFYG